MTEPEVQRIKHVYETYRQSSVVHRQWSTANPGNQAILRERKQAEQQLLHQAGFLPLHDHRILDIGCGSGRVLAGFMEWGAQPENLYGVDLLPERIDHARQHYPQLDFSTANAEQLNFPDAHFHLLLLYTVFTSILDTTMAHNVAHEAARVLKPGGAILWYDFRFNNPRNPHVRAMTRTKIHTLFPDFTHHLQTITLLPPLARRLGRLTPTLYPLLAHLPILRTHYLGLLIKKPPD